MHIVEAKGILSNKNTMNLYRGCTHGCIYCDSRSNCYQINHEFTAIEVKENAVTLLEETLQKKRNKCMVKTGSMTDPYIPIEKNLLMVRKSLEVIYKYGFGVSVITKSDLILRDIDLLKKINEKTKSVVQMTLTTYDDKLCEILEPNVCNTSKRFEVLKTLRDEKIPTVVWLCPILPFINDTFENLDGLLNYCIEAKVKGILCFNMGLTLREGNREYFYKMLDKHFPNMKEKYIKTYGNSYMVNSEHNNKLMAYFHKKCEENGILHNYEEIFKYLDTFEEKSIVEQISLL